ncbi:palmitoyltransferase pfa5 [Coniothyrium glycines]
MPPAMIGSQEENARDDTSALEQHLGQATSVVVPLLECGALAFVTWVLVYQICVQYLVNPEDGLRQNFDIQPRRATGIALISLYAVLLLLVLLPWLRLLQMIWSRPDILPLGDSSNEKASASTKDFAFDRYDAFICDYQGLPLWCEKCRNWKPDRTHHCKELGRCVRKMDHYCPWAGGIIAESTHKFFMQFVFFGTLYTTYTWVVTAIFLAERSSKMGSRPGTWIATLAVAVVFCIFGFSMTCMTGWNLMINYTSVEGIQRGGVQNIAFLISRMPPRADSAQISTQSTTPPSSSKKSPNNDSEDHWPVLCTVQRSSGKSYAVMQTQALEHPWYTGLLSGWKDTMGTNVIDWFLPLRQSPCKQRGRHGEFTWGEVVYDMARKYEADNPGTHLALLEGIR